MRAGRERPPACPDTWERVARTTRRSFLGCATLAAAGSAAVGGVNRAPAVFRSFLLSTLPPTSAPSLGPLSLVETLPTTHGNAARIAWADDGKTLYLANEEGGMSAVKLDASNPSLVRIAATSGAQNFNWAVAASGDVVLFRASYGGAVVRIAPTTWTPVWRKSWGEGHAIATDGSRVWIPVQGKPATLITAAAANGAEISRIVVPEGWPRIDSMRHEATTRRLYVGGKAFGVFIYDVRGPTPRLLGKISSPGGDIAVAGTRVWVHHAVERTNRIEAWDATDPAHPTMTGSYVGINRQDDAGRGLTVDFGDMTATGDGRRVFVTYNYGQLDRPAGVLMLDASGPAPTLLQTLDLTLPESPLRLEPTAVALSPDGKTLAYTAWSWGVFLFDVSRDRFSALGDGRGVATTGEAHDVYLDRTHAYVSANENTQILSLTTGERIQAVRGPLPGDGGWRPFKDGAIVYRTMPPSVWRLHDGKVESLGKLFDMSVNGGPSQTTDLVFADPYLYAATEGGPLFVLRIGAWNGRAYPSEVAGSFRVPPSAVHAICKWDQQLWLCGEDYGVVALDVSDPTRPRQIFADAFRFKQNGRHTGMVATARRVYAGCGDASVSIYDPQSLKRTGGIPGLNANFLDLYRGTKLIVANYWYAKLPDGMYMYDLAQNPDAPPLVAAVTGSPNFRVRAFSDLGLIARVSLSGIELYKVK